MTIMNSKYNKSISVFTDGSFIKKTNNGKTNIYAGYGVHFPDKQLDDISRPLTKGKLTNQRGELYAVYVALYRIHKYLEVTYVKVYSDSTYVVDTLNDWVFKWEANGWKRDNKKIPSNLDIIKPIFNKIMKMKKDGINIKLFYVRAHTKRKDWYSIHNSIVDDLAKEGAMMTK